MMMMMYLTMLDKKAVQFATAKKPTSSPIQYCVLGGLSSNPVKAWKEKIDWFVNSRQFRELDRTDGEPMKFEWKTFHGFTTLQILAEIQNMMSEVKCEPEHLQGLIIFMSMFHDIVWEKKETEKLALLRLQCCFDTTQDRGCWSSVSCRKRSVHQ